MLKWIVGLWTTSFIKTVKLNGQQIFVNIDFGGYMFITCLILVVLGIALGTFGTMIVLKFIKK